MTQALLDPPKAVRVPCDRCNGTGKRAVEWEITGAVVAFGPCGSCLGQGRVLEDAAA